MIVPFLPIIFAMIVMFGHQHDRCRGHVGAGAAVTRSHERVPAFTRRQPQAIVGCATETRARERKSASPRRIATPAAPKARRAPQAKAAVLPPPGRAGAGSDQITTDQVTAAVAIAKRMTADKSMASARTIGAPPPVVLLMARPDIGSVSELTGKDIAIDGSYSALGDRVRAAINEAGASEVKLIGSRTKAVSRVVDGQVPAAILAVVSPDAAESFPEVAGFRLFRIPFPR